MFSLPPLFTSHPPLLPNPASLDVSLPGPFSDPAESAAPEDPGTPQPSTTGEDIGGDLVLDIALNGTDGIDDYVTSHITDTAISGVSSVFIIVGIAANCLALMYFWPKRRKSLPSFLYTAVTIVDILKSCVSFPVVISLLLYRREVIFGVSGICTTWSVLFYFVIRMSMFLTMLLSLTRTLYLLYPFHKIKIKTILVSILAYSILILCIDGVYLTSNFLDILYKENECFCESHPNPATPSYLTYIYSVLLQLELIIPVTTVTVSLVVSTIVLQNKIRTREDPNLSRVSVTVAIFTAVFLVCSTSAFLLQLVYLIGQFDKDIFRQLWLNNVFRSYAHLLSHFVLVLFNGTLNPCLYFQRMPQFRQWTISLYKGAVEKIKAADTQSFVISNISNLRKGSNASNLRKGSNASNLRKGSNASNLGKEYSLRNKVYND